MDKGSENFKYFLNILYNRYNKWKEPKNIQNFIDRIINEWLKWDEEKEMSECRALFLNEFKPKSVSKAHKTKVFDLLWLCYWPRFY